MKTLAVSGGIGSGKTTVCNIFAEKGIPVYDSDSRTKELYDSSTGLASALKEKFGAGIYGSDGKLDRKALADSLFSSKDMLARLEAVVHPAVRADFLKWRDGFSDVPFVILESAIILDKPLFRDVIDRVLWVSAPVEVRVKRAAERDGTGAEAVRARVASQAEGHEKDADYLIVNDGSKEDLILKVNTLYTKIYNDFNHDGFK